MSKYDLARMNVALMQAPLDSPVMTFGLRDAFGPPGATAAGRPALAEDCCPAG